MIRASGDVPKSITGLAMVAFKSSNTFPKLVSDTAYFTASTQPKTIMDTNTGDRESETMGGTESGIFREIFFSSVSSRGR